MGFLHSTAADQRLRKRFRAVCAVTNAPCHICIRRGTPIELARIDYAAVGGPWSFECDHLQPIENGGELMSFENLGASHKRCNRAKGTRDIDKDPEYQGNWTVPDW